MAFKRIENADKVMEMEKKEFINYINKLLQEMSVEEKKISYMPTEQQVEKFCRKVQNGDIFVEYETHYYEFDSDGRYMDDKLLPSAS